MVRSRLGTRAPTAFSFTSRRSLARASYLVTAAALAVVMAVALRHVLETAPSRGPAIRAALVAAAAGTRSLSPTEAHDGVRDAIGPYFRSFDANIDASRFPAEVDVTLRDVDGVTCLEAEDEARRIEGPVVVQLEGYQSADTCRQNNVMTWRLLP
jgi:hypothetical protein